jgi:hypothetical protein
MRSIEDVLATIPAGNALDDAELWKELYAIALNTNLSIKTRARAVRKMDELTGEPESIAQSDDQSLVARFEYEMKKWGLKIVGDGPDC